MYVCTSVDDSVAKLFKVIPQMNKIKNVEWRSSFKYKCRCMYVFKKNVKTAYEIHMYVCSVYIMYVCM